MLKGREGEDTGGEEDEGKYEEELDPRIQEELEQLNKASGQINELELQLDEARSSYRRILSDSARNLNSQGSQLGVCIDKARPYYEARRLAKEQGRDPPCGTGKQWQLSGTSWNAVAKKEKNGVKPIKSCP